MQTISTAHGCLGERDGKAILLKRWHILVIIEVGEIKLQLTWKLSPWLLAFTAMERRYAAAGGKKAMAELSICEICEL